ncbi:hypothetical protein HYPBUDRAFT_7145 [Hyphopichia burtonii NRRL Y-1933]|uniref:Uncharacterized protein n=1 Tax=Hyphopichia burtonii NRRL Y-1933 TaxID=984485 RepID=A0A1E4RHL5_9ASCO|nr:hypothetical protein HYPBUDRAFT_7145 [Hyphopichia burtonii NRRL Y-1933]ODV66767.1 hypothetical protein HYPBUDRAFT_7145 [Hyphopichia burtonii NRRL Y-1933]
MSKAGTHISVTAIGLVKANGKNIRQEYQACTKSHEYEEEDNLNENISNENQNKKYSKLSTINLYAQVRKNIRDSGLPRIEELVCVSPNLFSLNLAKSVELNQIPLNTKFMLRELYLHEAKIRHLRLCDSYFDEAIPPERSITKYIYYHFDD